MADNRPSFAFYIPVVLLADVIPMIGMLMIPKTCAYVWTVLIGFKAMKKEIAQDNHMMGNELCKWNI